MILKYNSLSDYRIQLLHCIKSGSKKEVINLIYGIVNQGESYLRNLLTEDIYITHDKVRDLLKIVLEECIKYGLNDCIEISYSIKDIKEYIDTQEINCEFLKTSCINNSDKIVNFLLTNPLVKFKPTIGGLNYKNTQNNTKITPLSIACSYNSKNVIDYLIKTQGSEIISQYNYLALICTIKSDNVEILDYLINNTKYKNKVDQTFFTKLFIESVKAINSNSVNCRKYLIVNTNIILNNELREMLKAMGYFEELKMLENKINYSELNKELKININAKENTIVKI